MSQSDGGGMASPSAPQDDFRDEPELARRVVREGADVLKSAGVTVGYVGPYALFTDKEAHYFDEARKRIEAYRDLKKPERPLCLAVFGPPGSGKSFGVKHLCLEVLDREPVTLNLSQLEGPRHLADWMARVKEETPAGEIPLVFFDEFDSQLAGTPLGWLQWLLAPMHDGKFILEHRVVKLERAIFFFAGGTADTFEDFQAGPAREFRPVKGPDFVSRLRGHINIPGVNSWPYRRVRRAVILRSEVEKLAPRLIVDGQISGDAMSDEFIDALLGVGRYRHGARSVGALVQMSTQPDETAWNRQLPPPTIRANHVDLGPLTDTVIALSAGGIEKDGDGQGDFEAALMDVWTTVATRLLEQGAALIYGGNPREGGFVDLLVQARERLPKLLPPDEATRRPWVGEDRLPAGTVTWVRHKADRVLADEGRRWDDLTQLEWGELSDDEYRDLGLDAGTTLDFDNSSSPVKGSLGALNRLAYTVTMFRMRALVTRHADVHLAFGGKESGYKGRLPGVVEEVMLSLAAGKPVFLCGGFGGATQAVGEVLGLGNAWLAGLPRALRGEPYGAWFPVPEEDVRAHGQYFQLPHRPDLPLTFRELVTFLRKHALGSPGWPYNGLTPQENRALFGCQDAGKIFELVETGLRRLGKA